MVSMDRKEMSSRGPDLKLFVRDVRDRQGKKRPVTVRSWATIKDVKDTIQQLLHVPPSAQRLYFGPLLTSGGELPNHRSLHDAGIYRSGETLLLDIKGTGISGTSSAFSIFSLRSSSGNDVCISSSMIDSTPRQLRSIVHQARRGFALGLKPEFVLDGSGGTYFLHDARKNKVAVFKPADEEPYAENNPRGYLPQPGQPVALREGIFPGEACIREVAAYHLDHDGFSGVPMTTLAEARHPAFNNNGSRLTVAEGGACIGSHSITPNSPVKPPCVRKPGSFQQFIRCECSMDDISPSMIGAHEVQKIAILDIRIMNADRNSANLMVRRRQDNSLELVPIDHGYCLRSLCDVSWMDWCWLDWPQLKEPLDDKVKKYVLDLDIEADARMLQERLNICQQAVDNFRASSSLLKAGVKAGLTLYDIAIMCCRNDNMGIIPSKLEVLHTMASELAFVAVENERWHHAAASRALVEQLSPKTGLYPREGSRKRIHKSQSSVEVASLGSASADSLLGNAFVGDGSPGMAQSSASSDSSSEGGDVACEKDECEQWAASVIAGVSAEQIRPVSRESRSDSLASDDSSSDSVKGFWYIRPGATPPSIGTSDDGSISWSPLSDERMLVDVDPNPVTPDGTLNVDQTAKSNKKTAVTFADLPPEPPFLPPATVNVSQYKSTGLEMDFSGLQRQESGMIRSKSYSALSRSFSIGSGTTSTNNGISKRSLEPFSDEYRHFRKYLLKFIDLVIVRETTAAIHQSNQSNEVVET